MKTEFQYGKLSLQKKELIAIASFTKKIKKQKKEEYTLDNSHWPHDLKEAFNKVISSTNFKGKSCDTFIFHLKDGASVLAFGMGEKEKIDQETLRKNTANLYKMVKNNTKRLDIILDSFVIDNNITKTAYIMLESLLMTEYDFTKHKTESEKPLLQTICLATAEKKSKQLNLEDAQHNALIVAESINFARDLVNDPPNLCNSETLTKMIKQDATKLKGVKIKILNKQELKRQKMNLLLSVNAGSNYEPHVVHLTYTPQKSTKNTKHIALVGKGLTFDTGGYSLKPSTSMINMKFDMAGAATVYAAFRAAVLSKSHHKLTCVLGITDNAIGPKATMPDSIIKSRNGKTVEILNTDAEGRLVLADCLDYTCDLKPDTIIDAATLTGAVLVALGSEVCGLMGNNLTLTAKLLEAAKKQDEYMWELPIIEEFKKEIKSPNADLKNVGNSRNAGSAKAAAFLQEFIKNNIAWAHLDIAGIGDAQSHLPYCPAKGASGLMIRTLAHFLTRTELN